MHGRLDRYNRRQRKKLRLGEFREWGFEIHALPAGDLSPAAHDAFMDAVVAEAIEASSLLIGGGFNDELWGYVMAEGRRASATEVHIEAVRAWLAARSEVQEVRVGPLSDAWHGWK